MNMSDVYKELTTIVESIQPKIGIFWYIPEKNILVSDMYDKLEGYFYQRANIYTYKSTHHVYWNMLSNRFRGEDEFVNDWQFYPRGRVNYNTETGKYEIVMCNLLDDPKVKDMIIKEFMLPVGKIEYDFTDEHYYK